MGMFVLNPQHWRMHTSPARWDCLSKLWVNMLHDSSTCAGVATSLQHDTSVVAPWDRIWLCISNISTSNTGKSATEFETELRHLPLHRVCMTSSTSDNFNLFAFVHTLICSAIPMAVRFILSRTLTELPRRSCGFWRSFYHTRRRGFWPSFLWEGSDFSHSSSDSLCLYFFLCLPYLCSLVCWISSNFLQCCLCNLNNSKHLYSKKNSGQSTLQITVLTKQSVAKTLWEARPNKAWSRYCSAAWCWWFKVIK